MENKQMKGIIEVLAIIIYGFCNRFLLSVEGPIGVVINVLWTLAEIVIYLHISKIDPNRTNKLEMAARIGISPSDPRLSRVIRELKPYAWPYTGSVAVLNKLLNRTEIPYNVEVDDGIYK